MTTTPLEMSEREGTPEPGRTRARGHTSVPAPTALDTAVVGHDDAKASLNRSLAQDRLAHAYLFVGPPGVGKRTLALALARALNCPDAGIHRSPGSTFDSRACSVCRRIEAGKHPDVECVSPGGICDESDHDHAADAGRDIRICQVRRAERVLGIAPFEGGRRVLIVDPAEALNQQAADAFLKTLEEPPGGAVIILLAADEGMIAETIRSRCRRLPLRPLPAAEAARALVERFGATPERAGALIRLFGGRIGRAVSALRDDGFDERRAAMLDLAEQVATGSLIDRFAVAERLADAYARRERPATAPDGEAAATTAPVDGKARTRPDVLATLDLWIEWWRDLLLASGGAESDIINRERRPRLRELAAGLGVADASAGVEALRDARRDLDGNINPRLALEALMLRLPRIGNREQGGGNREQGTGNR